MVSLSKLRMNLAFLFLLLLIFGIFFSTFEAQACGANAVLLQNPDDDVTSTGGRSDREKRSASRTNGGHFGFPMGDEAPPSAMDVESKVEPREDFEFKWCVDSWVNNSKNVITAIFDEEHNPRMCSEFCMGREFQVSMLKGGECTCESILTFKLQKRPDGNCNVPCPVSSMVNPDVVPPNPASSCGGNNVYSVYCNNNGPVDCAQLPVDTGGDPTLSVANHVGNEDEFLVKNMAEFPFCGRCDLETSCMSGTGGITPSYDYFPKNEPYSCRSFCGKEQRYGRGRMEEGVRLPTRYAVLVWDSVLWFGNPVPICRCMSDVSSFKVEDDSKCTAPCPGDHSSRCGRTEEDPQVPQFTYYATIYCTRDGCTDPNPSTTTTTTKEPTTTTTKSSSTTPSTSATSPTTTVGGEETTPDEEDCTDSAFSAGCSATTDQRSDTHTPEEVSSSSTLPTTSTLVSTTEEIPSHINCAVECVGTEFSGRSWIVCSGQVEEKDCDKVAAVGKAVWECDTNGQFVTEQPDYSGCKSTWIDEAVEGSFHVNDTTSAIAYLDHLNELISHHDDTTHKPNYFGHEITMLTDVLDRVVDTASQTSHDLTEFLPVAEKTIGLTGTIVTASEPWNQLGQANRSSVSTNLLRTVEDTSLLLSFKVPLDGDASSFHYEKPLTPPSSSYLVVAGAVSKLHGDLNGSYDFPGTELSYDSSLLKLPPGWKNLIVGDSIQYVGMFLSPEQANVMLPGQFKSLGHETNSNEKTLLNGKMMSFTIGSLSEGRKAAKVREDIKKSKIVFPGQGVQIVFYHELAAWGESRADLRRKLHYGEKPSAALGSARCAYWDTVNLVWSTKGCKTVEKGRHQTVCECTHLTSFAVLMDIHNYLGKDLGLEILTLLLCSLSFLSLFVSVTIFSTFHGIQSERNSITKNLSICLLIGNTMVLLVLDRNYFNMSEGFCVASGIMTHYVFLAAFAWMAVEGVHLYRMVVHVFDSENNPLNMYRVMAYGIPLILVILTTMIGYLKGDKPYGGDAVCWLEGSYIWSFLVPVVFVVVENLIILFIALKTAYQVQYSSQKTMPAFQNRIRSFRIWLRGCLSLTILLGVTWLIGFFTLVPDTPGLVAAYLFTIFNASQGIFIFIFHCLYNDKIRSVTYQRVGNYLPSWISNSLRHSSSASSYPSDGGKRNDSQTMKHSASDSSLSSKQRPPREAINYSMHPGITTEGSEKRKLSPIIPTKLGNDYSLDFEPGRRLPPTGIISIIGDQGHPQVVNRRGSLIRQQQHWDSFGTVSSIDSIRVPDDPRGGSLSDSSCAGGNSTDHSDRALIR